MFGSPFGCEESVFGKKHQKINAPYIKSLYMEATCNLGSWNGHWINKAGRIWGYKRSSSNLQYVLWDSDLNLLPSGKRLHSELENHHFEWVNPLQMAIFYVAFCMFTRPGTSNKLQMTWIARELILKLAMGSPGWPKCLACWKFHDL